MDKDYFKTLKERGKESKVYRDFQALGLEIAELLQDKAHKALYIKLAKKHDGSKLLAIAKDISQRENVTNKGAYFMTLITRLKHDATNDAGAPGHSHDRK